MRERGNALRGPSGPLRSAAGCLAVGLVAAFVSAAHAQPAASGLAREFDLLFQQLLENPSDPALNARFIQIAVELQDYEAAIGSLDRLLFYDPTNAALQLQTGEMYMAMGSYIVAKSYFEMALENAGADLALRARAEALIAEVDRLTRPSPWSVFAQAGVRYQSNASSGPDRLDGADEGGNLQESDWNAFGLAVVSYAQPIGNVVIESTLSGYYADQVEIDRLDLGSVELIAGPRLVLPAESGRGPSIKLYGLIGGTLLGDDEYQRTLGGGLSARFALADIATIEPYVEYRDRRFYDSDDYPTASDQTGDRLTYALYSTGPLGSNVRWTSRIGLHQNDARVEDNSYDHYFSDVSLSFRFNPFEGGDANWAFTPFASVNWREYQAPEPGETETREDFEWRAGARLDVPANEQLGLALQVQYSRNNSNLTRFDYDNVQVTAGPTVRF